MSATEGSNESFEIQSEAVCVGLWSNNNRFNF